MQTDPSRLPARGHAPARVGQRRRSQRWSSAAHLALGLSVGVAILLAPVAARAQDRPSSDAPPVTSAPSLPIITLGAGIHRIKAEVADSAATRARGLMMRERLGANEGMLFVFDSADVHCFWMRNTLLPLSIAFIADDGRIVNIERMQPLSEDSHCPRRAVRYALEMEQGWFAAKGIAAGDAITGIGRPGR